MIIKKLKFHLWMQNRRAKWRKREPPRKGAYIATNSPSTQLGTPLGPPFAAFQQGSTVSPPGSVDSWASYQSPYELSPHFNVLSPTASPYGSFTTQYSTYVHDNQLFPLRQHFEYGSPSRAPGTEIDDKNDHYTTIDDKYENPCAER